MCLILLTVSPFTAPFSTCDDAELTAESAPLDNGSKKFATDAVDAGEMVSIGLPTAVLVAMIHLAEPSTQTDRSDLLTVLRL